MAKLKMLSDLGNEMNQLSGVRQINKDIEEVLRAGKKKKIYDFGAGNPAIIPQVLAEVRKTAREVVDSEEFGAVFCRYGSTGGYAPFMQEFGKHLRKHTGLKAKEENIIVTPGSQMLYYYAANAFAGKAKGKNKKILFPLVPEYTGYMHLGVGDAALVGVKPKITITGKHEFKYNVHFDHLNLNGVGLVVFSRPSNPSGNVLHDSEVREIVRQAGKRNIPVMIDCAYAPPVPNVCYAPMKFISAPNVITTFSFSKAGLAAARVGVAVGAKELIEPLKAFQANACLFPPIFGQEVARRMLANGSMVRLCKGAVNKHYHNKHRAFRNACSKYLDGSAPYYIHKSEGTFFAWVWFEGLPCSDWKLFELLKEAGVIVVPGSPFFPGAGKGWKHAKECIRFSLIMDDKQITEGVRLMAEVVNKLYKK